jgi:hypothetical protein
MTTRSALPLILSKTLADIGLIFFTVHPWQARNDPMLPH